MGQVYLLHRGVVTELLSQNATWRVVIRYQNPQPDGALYKLDLELGVEKNSTQLLYAGEVAIAAGHLDLDMTWIHSNRWNLAAHMTSNETSHFDSVANSIDVAIDLFALVSLLEATDSSIHIENLSTKNSIRLLNIWTRADDGDMRFSGTVECSRYCQRVNYEQTKQQTRLRIRVVLPAAMLLQIRSFAECCDRLCVSPRSDILRISTQSIIWLQTNPESPASLSAVCSSSVKIS